MNFFKHQEQARRFTAKLIGLLVLALVILTGGLYLICGYLFSDHLDTGIGWWDPILFAYVASGTLALVGGGSIYKITQLRSGGPRVARSLGGERVDHGTKDPELRRLVNVVELQGVIAHEFSHIINGDMRQNVRLMGLVHGLLCISLAGSLILRGSFGQRRGHRNR